MPLAPLPASNTKRYFLGLVTPQGQHHSQVRCPSSVTDAEAVTAFTGLVDLLKTVTFDDCSFNELLVALEGSDIRNPVGGWTATPGTVLGGLAGTEGPKSICARGRSSSGRKVRLFLYGQLFSRDNDWLYVPAAESVHDLITTAMNTSANFFYAIDGTKPVWEQDWTVNYNDHWVDVLRP